MSFAFRLVSKQLIKYLIAQLFNVKNWIFHQLSQFCRLSFTFTGGRNTWRAEWNVLDRPYCTQFEVILKLALTEKKVWGNISPKYSRYVHSLAFLFNMAGEFCSTHGGDKNPFSQACAVAMFWYYNRNTRERAEHMLMVTWLEIILEILEQSLLKREEKV